MKRTLGPADASQPGASRWKPKGLREHGHVDDPVSVTVVLLCNRSHTEG